MPASAMLPVALALVLGGALHLWQRCRVRADGLAREGERLRAERRKLRALLDSTTEGIVVLDAGDRIEFMNPAAEVMFGRLQADATGQPARLLLPEAVLAEHPQPPVEQAVPGVYETAALHGARDRFPARIAERRLMLDDGPQRLLLVQDLTEQQQQAQALAFLEQRDVLTGLLNRSEFERRMGRLLAAAVDRETPHVLCCIDIDHFKLVNDTVGHVAGDALLRQLAKLIEGQFSAATLLGRLGGDEFGALFAEHAEAEALALCRELVETVRHFLFTWRERSFDIAISIGVTAFLPEHDSPEAELARADVACQMAKREGRDRVHVYRDSDASLARHHGDMHLVSSISKALRGGRFRLYGQPIAPLRGSPGEQSRTHFEVLVRMLDEHHRPVPPERFIPAAERYILMPAVDRWVIRQLFRSQGQRLRDWHRAHPDDFLYAINLSATSVNDEGFLPYLKRQLELHRIPPAGICLEVTETAAIGCMHKARRFMHSLAALGCCFALDDFGSGLASYAQLRELPLHYLKIDGSFVRDMRSDPVNRALVASINQIAHVLGLKTIAEWAEDQATIELLRDLDIDYVQGFAIGAPLPLDDCAPAPDPQPSEPPESAIRHA